MMASIIAPKTMETKLVPTNTETLSSSRRETLVPDSHITRLHDESTQRSGDPFTFKNDPLYRTLFWNDYWIPRSKRWNRDDR